MRFILYDKWSAENFVFIIDSLFTISSSHSTILCDLIEKKLERSLAFEVMIPRHAYIFAVFSDQ